VERVHRSIPGGVGYVPQRREERRRRLVGQRGCGRHRRWRLDSEWGGSGLGGVGGSGLGGVGGGGDGDGGIIRRREPGRLGGGRGRRRSRRRGRRRLSVVVHAGAVGGCEVDLNG